MTLTVCTAKDTDQPPESVDTGLNVLMAGIFRDWTVRDHMVGAVDTMVKLGWWEIGCKPIRTLALLLAWLREAKRQDRELAVANLPQGLTTIARLYGVAELLSARSAALGAHH